MLLYINFTIFSSIICVFISFFYIIFLLFIFSKIFAMHFVLQNSKEAIDKCKII